MAEVGRLLEGADSRLTIFATETLPLATMTDELERGDMLGIAASLFAASTGTLKARRETRSHLFPHLRQELKAHLQREVGALKDLGIRAECVVEIGELASSALAYAKDNDVEAIVMSTSWSGDLASLAKDPSAKSLLEAATVPLILIPLTVRGG